MTTRQFGWWFVPYMAVACFATAADPTAGQASAYGTKKSSTAPKAPVEKKGIHFAFDASESMCGYLQGKDDAKIFLNLIKRATALRDDEKNHRVMLIRQQATKPNAAKDIIEAPANLQSLADAAGIAARGKCAPFDGIDSNIDLIFAASSPTATARSIILVSDMQLKEEAQISFVDQFRAWARRSAVDGPLSAGILTVRTAFAGKYFPVAESDAARKRAGYTLPLHDRPLSIVWFVVGKEDMAAVRKTLEELGVFSSDADSKLAYGLQVLPIATEKLEDFLSSSESLTSAAALFSTPNTSPIKALDRSPLHLKDCVSAKLSGSDLAVKVQRKCRDDKPFFDGVSGFDVILPMRREAAVTIKPNSGTTVDGKNNVIVPFARSTEAVRMFPLPLVGVYPTLAAAKLQNLNVDSDACPATKPTVAVGEMPVTWEFACAEALAGKIYRYESLTQQLLARAKVVRDEQLAAQPLTLRVSFER